MPATHSSTGCASRASALLTLLLLSTLCACAQVPTIAQPGATAVRVRGSNGPLSQAQADAVLDRVAAQSPNAGALERHLAIEQTVAGSALYTGNAVSILRDGPQTFAAMFAAIQAAKQYLYLEYYILEDVNFNGQQLGELLLERRQQGLQVNLIYDTVGSLSTPNAFFDRLKAAGVHVQQFGPVNPLSAHFSLNDRDHRKILIADGQSAIIGGVNLSTDYQSGSALGSSAPQGTANDGRHEQWHDTDLQIQGPAVRDLQHLFEQHWRQQGGSPADLVWQSPTPNSQGSEVVRIIGSQAGQLTPRYYATLLSAIRSATARIWLTAAYFVPTHQQMRALDDAARRGVDVELLLPSHSDSPPALAAQQSHYSALLRAGVKIYERDDGILHSKIMITDGAWSIVGSSNFDHRSVLFNDEVDAVVIGTDTAAQLEHFFEQDLQHAQRIQLSNWQQRPFSRKMREHFWRLWEQLL